jgi:hypothetical protein
MSTFCLMGCSYKALILGTLVSLKASHKLAKLKSNTSAGIYVFSHECYIC